MKKKRKKYFIILTFLAIIISLYSVFCSEQTNFFTRLISVAHADCMWLEDSGGNVELPAQSWETTWEVAPEVPQQPDQGGPPMQEEQAAPQQGEIPSLQGGDFEAARREEEAATQQVGSGGGDLQFAPGNDYVKLEDGTYGFKMTDGNYYWQDTDGSFNPVDMSGVSGGAAGAGGASDGSVITTRDLVGKTDDGYQVYKDNNGNYSELRGGQLYSLEGTSGININPLSTSEQAAASSAAAASGQSGAGSAVGIKDGQFVFKNSTTGELYTVGSDGYKKTMDQDASFTQLTASQQAAAASGQLQIGQGGVTSYTPAQIITGPDGKLYQTAGGQMVPYTGSTIASGGYAGTGGGIFGALGSAVGSVVGGVGSAFNSLLGGVFGTGGTTGGYYGTTGGYSSPGGYYGTTGGYSNLGGGTMMGGTSAGGWNPANYASTGLPASSIYSIVRNIVMWALSLFGFFGIIGFVISGVWYLLASGDDALMKRAKNGMLYSIIGVVVGLIGLVIIYAANSLLNGSWFF